MAGFCNRCYSVAKIQDCTFYWFDKREGVYRSDLCLSCMTKVFLHFTLWNLVSPIWTVWGLFVGPYFIVINTVKYIIYIFRFKRKAF